MVTKVNIYLTAECTLVGLSCRKATPAGSYCTEYKWMLLQWGMCLRPYHTECTGSRLITEVKECLACLVLWWVTTLELQVLQALFFLFFFLSSFFFGIWLLAMLLRRIIIAELILSSFQSRFWFVTFTHWFLFSHFNLNLLTYCGKKSVFIWHRIQVDVVVMGLVPTTIPHIRFWELLLSILAELLSV